MVMEYFPFFTVSLMVWLMASLDMEAEDLSIFTMEPVTEYTPSARFFTFRLELPLLLLLLFPLLLLLFPPFELESVAFFFRPLTALDSFVIWALTCFWVAFSLS